LDELGELRDDGSLAWVEKDIVGVRNSAEEVEASTGFLKFVDVFDPDKLVIRQFSENLVGGRHLQFLTRAFMII
jgi:hypothetical protein